MTSAQATIFRFLQDRVSVHMSAGNSQQALRIASVLVEAARREYHPPPAHLTVTRPVAPPTVVPPGQHAPSIAVPPGPPGQPTPPAAVPPGPPGPPAQPAQPPAQHTPPTAEPTGQHAPDAEHSSPLHHPDDQARLRFDIFFQAAEVYRTCGDLDAALTVFREAVEISENEPEQIEPLEIAHLNHNFASLHDQLGDEEKAEQFYQTALDQLVVLDPQPLEQIANISNNLAMISRNGGKLEVAEERYLKALEIFEQLRGEDHLDVAVVCNNLGSLYWAWHHPEMARDLHLRALAIRRKHLPDTDPDVAQSACNLAAVYHDMKDFDQASRNYQRGLKILLKNIDTDSDSYQVVANNYADLLRENGQEKKATSLIKKVDRHLAAKAKSEAKSAAGGDPSTPAK